MFDKDVLLEIEASPLSSICHRFHPALVSGTLLRRYKRFLADVRLSDGSMATAHCPNSGSMLGCLEEGAPVYCSESDKPERRTSHTWEMIQINGSWVGINTNLPNGLVAQAAHANALPLFEGVLEVKREVRISPKSRIDLVAERENGPLIVEVKNVTMVRDGEARFPDAVTTRGAKHLRELIRLRSEGTECAMVYIVQRQDATCFGPAREIDSQYADLFLEARRAGVLMTAVQARVDPQAICLEKELPILI